MPHLFRRAGFNTISIGKQFPRFLARAKDWHFKIEKKLKGEAKAGEVFGDAFPSE